MLSVGRILAAPATSRHDELAEGASFSIERRWLGRGGMSERSCSQSGTPVPPSDAQAAGTICRSAPLAVAARCGSHRTRVRDGCHEASRIQSYGAAIGDQPALSRRPVERTKRCSDSGVVASLARQRPGLGLLRTFGTAPAPGSVAPVPPRGLHLTRVRVPDYCP
jgi:hypothetical protein